jgi:hypothetical protein
MLWIFGCVFERGGRREINGARRVRRLRIGDKKAFTNARRMGSAHVRMLQGQPCGRFTEFRSTQSSRPLHQHAQCFCPPACHAPDIPDLKQAFPARAVWSTNSPSIRPRTTRAADVADRHKIQPLRLRSSLHCVAVVSGVSTLPAAELQELARSTRRDRYRR